MAAGPLDFGGGGGCPGSVLWRWGKGTIPARVSCPLGLERGVGLPWLRRRFLPSGEAAGPPRPGRGVLPHRAGGGTSGSGGPVSLMGAAGTLWLKEPCPVVSGERGSRGWGGGTLPRRNGEEAGGLYSGWDPAAVGLELQWGGKGWA